MLYNALISGIRTGIALLVGLAITWLVNQGVTLPDGAEAQLNAILFVVVSAGYNALVNWLAVKVHPAFGYLLGVPKTPEYNAVAVQEKDGQIVASANSPITTGEIVVVQPAEPHDPAKVDNFEPHPYETEE